MTEKNNTGEKQEDVAGLPLTPAHSPQNNDAVQVVTEDTQSLSDKRKTKVNVNWSDGRMEEVKGDEPYYREDDVKEFVRKFLDELKELNMDVYNKDIKMWWSTLNQEIDKLSKKHFGKELVE